VATVSVPLNPFGLTVSPSGRQLYVANWGDYSNVIPIAGHSVQIFDTATLKLLGVISVGDYPSSIAFTPDGKLALVVNNTQPGSVTVIRTRDRQVVNTVDVGVCPTTVAISTNGHRAYVTNTGVGAICAVAQNTVSVLSIDHTTDTPRPVRCLESKHSSSAARMSPTRFEFALVGAPRRNGLPGLVPFRQSLRISADRRVGRRCRL